MHTLALACSLWAWHGAALADVGIYAAAASSAPEAWQHLNDIQAKISSANASAGLGLGQVVPHRLCSDTGLTPACITTPTLAELQQYTAVLVFSNVAFPDPVALGNVLADYVDAGGTVVVTLFALGSGNPSTNHIHGRLATNGYLPVTQSSNQFGTRLTLCDSCRTLPSHPLLQGVNRFDGGTSSFHSPIAIANGGTLVATWSDAGTPLIAVKDNVVGLNFFPPSSDSHSSYWEANTDGGRIMANALAWATRLANPELPTGKVAQPYAGYTLTALNGTAPLTWSAATGLPSGMNFTVGTLAGTPSQAGLWLMQTTFTDSHSTPRQRAQTLPLAIHPADATAGQAYSQTLGSSGRYATQTMSLTGLPTGLSFDPATQTLSGSTTELGSFPLSLQFTDTNQNPAVTSPPYTLTLEVLPPLPLSLSPSALPTATAGQPYSQAISASGGVAPLSLSVTGLPAGLTFNPSTGLIAGTPTAHGAATITVTVSDSQSPAATQTTTLSLEVLPAPPLSLSPTALPDATLGQPYSQAISASGGVAPLSLTVTGLPDGLTFDASTGLIAGTPVATAKALTAAGGTVAVTLSVQDSSTPPATQSVTLDLRVLPAAVPAEAKPVPALGAWGLGLLGTLTAAATLLRRRKSTHPLR